jgi:hypothetical protein
VGPLLAGAAAFFADHGQRIVDPRRPRRQDRRCAGCGSELEHRKLRGDRGRLLDDDFWLIWRGGTLTARRRLGHFDDETANDITTSATTEPERSETVEITRAIGLDEKRDEEKCRKIVEKPYNRHFVRAIGPIASDRDRVTPLSIDPYRSLTPDRDPIAIDRGPIT